MLSSIVLAVVYAGVGIAPLVYTYLAAREAREEYERRISRAVEEPLVPVHVVVVVKGDDVNVETIPGRVGVEELVEESGIVEAGEDYNLAVISAMGPRIEGIPRSLEAVGGEETVTA